MLMHPFWLLLLLALPLPWLLLRRRGHVGYSDTRLVQDARFSRILIWAPLVLFELALASLIVCIARPQVPRPAIQAVIQSRDIILAVDISASMDAPYAGKIPPPEKSDPELDKQLPPIPKARPREDRYGYSRYYDDERSTQRQNRRIDAAQQCVMRFTRHRFQRAQGDRIAAIVFDTEPHWSWPLTDDLKQIYRKCLFISEGMGGGTNFGDTDPGPIDWAYDHFLERGKAAARVVIMVTDGEDNIGGRAMGRLQSKINELGIKLYVIGVGPALNSRGTDLERLAQSTGGKVFRAENAAEMTQCFDSIDEMERSPVEIDRPGGYRDIFPVFALLALGFLISAVAVDAFIVRQ